MNRLLNIFPTLAFITYMTVGEFTGFRTGAMQVATLVLALSACVTICVLMSRDSTSAIDKGFAAFLLLACAGYWIYPDKIFLAKFSPTLLFVIFLLLAVVPPLLGREPFTEHFARRVTPAAVWQTSVFRRINLNITWAWSGIFAASAVVTAIPGIVPDLDVFPWKLIFHVGIPAVLMVGVGIPLNKHYPGYYQRKIGLAPAGVAESTRDGERPEPSRSRSAASREREMKDAPDIVAINGSPHESIGNTSLLIAMLKENLSREGLQLEEIFLCRHDIQYCLGCAMCLEKGSCWIKDDHKQVVSKALEAKALILASPVYFFNVTAQMKTFLDRSLGFGHRPRQSWKPGLVITVSAGWGETNVAQYLGDVLRAFGAFSIGQLTAIAASPGEFIGKDAVEERAADLARELAQAIRTGKRYPATDRDLAFWHFMGDLIRQNKELMRTDHDHWEQSGFYNSFETYVGQTRAPAVRSPEMRKEWIKELIRRKKQTKQPPAEEKKTTDPLEAATARELLEMMPHGLKAEASEGLSITYQFEIEGGENFTAHIKIQDQKASFHEGPAENPDVTIKSPADVWLAISKGELDGAQAFMSGKYKVEGDLACLMKLSALFGSAKR